MKRRVKKTNTKKRNKRNTKNRYNRKRYTKKRYNKKMKGGSFFFNMMGAKKEVDTTNTVSTLEDLVSGGWRLEALPSRFVQHNFEISDLHEDITLTLNFNVSAADEGTEENISIGLNPRLHDGPALDRVSSGELVIQLYASEHSEGLHDFELLIGNTLKDTETSTIKKVVFSQFQINQIIPRESENLSQGMKQEPESRPPESEEQVVADDRREQMDREPWKSVGERYAELDLDRLEITDKDIRDAGLQGHSYMQILAYVMNKYKLSDISKFLNMNEPMPELVRQDYEIIQETARAGELTERISELEELRDAKLHEAHSHGTTEDQLGPREPPPHWRGRIPEPEPEPEPEPVSEFGEYQELYPPKECVDFNSGRNINIVYDILSREALPGSNIYIHIDHAHGSIIGREIILNSKFHLLLTVSRGQTDFRNRDIKDNFWMNMVISTLSFMKSFLDNNGYNNLFNDVGCMTLHGSLLFYAFYFLKEYYTPTVHSLMKNLESNYNNQTTSYRESRKRKPEIRLSEIFRLIFEYYRNSRPGKSNESIKNSKSLLFILQELLFRTLKLYNPDEIVNDALFCVEKEERERERERERGSLAPQNHVRWGVTILYTNTRNENKYIHLPLNEIPRIRGDIRLSQILDYLKPLSVLNHRFFLKHFSCRVDDEYFQNPHIPLDKAGSARLELVYNPDLFSLTRKISTPKEIAQKECFINYFREGQRDEVRGFLRAYPTMIDYYVWLDTTIKRDRREKGQSMAFCLKDYTDILLEHGEGSQKLYEYIKSNYSLTPRYQGPIPNPDDL